MLADVQWLTFGASAISSWWLLLVEMVEVCSHRETMVEREDVMGSCVCDLGCNYDVI